MVLPPGVLLEPLRNGVLLGVFEGPFTLRANSGIGHGWSPRMVLCSRMAAPREASTVTGPEAVPNILTYRVESESRAFHSEIVMGDLGCPAFRTILARLVKRLATPSALVEAAFAGGPGDQMAEPPQNGPQRASAGHATPAQRGDKLS